jgi:hypothetical protein
MPGTKDDFAAAVAKDAVDENIMDTSEVDFVWVIRGFLSYYFPTNHGWKGEDDIVLAVIAHPCLLQRRICQIIHVFPFEIHLLPIKFGIDGSAMY